MAIKFIGNGSLGQPFEVGETRTVDLSGENLSAASGYEGETITYTVTIIDNTTAKLPATFVATLKINGTDLITDQVFDAGVYNQTTGLLTLDFTVPSAVGSFTVSLVWAEQII